MNRKRVIISILMVFLLVGLVGCGSNEDPVKETPQTENETTDKEIEERQEEKYQEALALEATDKEAAIRIYEGLNDYKDASEKVSDYKFDEGMKLYEEKNYTKALVYILQSEKYEKDSDFISDIYETIGDDAWEKGKQKYALSMYENMNDDTKLKAKEAEIEASK